MKIWQRWFGVKELEPLQHLLRQRRIIEQRGCFSDQELDVKYCELAVIDRRIEAVKVAQSRRLTQSASTSMLTTTRQRWQNE